MDNIISATALSWSTKPTCRICGCRFDPPEVGRPQVYCSQACRQSAYRARVASHRARAAAAEVRSMLAAVNSEFTDRSGDLAAAICAMDESWAASPTDLPTGWETQISRGARHLREVLDRIQDLVNDHSQLAYRHRIAVKRLAPALLVTTGIAATQSAEHPLEGVRIQPRRRPVGA
jgi:hypothetical protein